MTRVLLIAFLCTVGIPPILYAQGNWENYMTRFDDGKIGSVLVDLSRYEQSPDKRYPFEVITGPECNECDKDGMPAKEEVNTLEDILGVAGNTVTSMSENVLVGTLTYNNARMNYYYVKDTGGMRRALTKMYNKFFKDYNYIIRINTDPEWTDYRNFLYPNDQTFTWIDNNKIIDKLMLAGDSLATPREVDFYIYFSDKDDRAKFASFAKDNGYDILEAGFLTNAPRPYELKIAKNTSVKPDVMWPLANQLKEETRKYNNAHYDGWETTAITGK